MRFGIVVVSGFAALAGCAPLNTYYKTGASVATVARETTDCEVSALAKVPVSTQIRREPARFVPPQEICNSNGKCTIIPARYVPGPIYTVDENAALRGRVTQKCMADKGFVPASIPACPSAVARAAPARATQTLPTLTTKSCFIRNSDGSFQIVNQG